MDDTKRRAMIKAQAAKKKKSDDVDPKGTGSSNSFIKRKLPSNLAMRRVDIEMNKSIFRQSEQNKESVLISDRK